MRPNIRSFVKLAESVINLSEPVYEFGAFQIEGQEALADLRPIFIGKKYVGCDMAPGKGVDRIENLEKLSLGTGSVGSAVCTDTLEHVERPEEAVREIHRVLVPGGVLILASVMDFPIHNYPADYWRFTPQGFKSLLSIFPAAVVGWQGHRLQPHTVFGIGFKDAERDIAGIHRELVRRAGTEIRTGMAASGAKRGLATLCRAFMGRGYSREMIDKYLLLDQIEFEIAASRTLQNADRR